MALIGKIEKEKDSGGIDRDILKVSINNGSLQQLRDLAVFLRKRGFTIGEKDEDLSEVVRVGLSFLLNLKDKEKNSKDPE